MPLDETVPVFQKPFRLTQDVTVDHVRRSRDDGDRIAGTVDYQACDDQRLLPAGIGTGHVDSPWSK